VTKLTCDIAGKGGGEEQKRRGKLWAVREVGKDKTAMKPKEKEAVAVVINKMTFVISSVRYWGSAICFPNYILK